MWFFLKVRFKYLEEKYCTYWIVSYKYFIVGPYFLDPISCGFFSKYGLNIKKKNIWHIGFFFLMISYVYVTIIACLYSERLPLYKINHFSNTYTCIFSGFFSFCFLSYMRKVHEKYEHHILAPMLSHIRLVNT